MIRTKKNQNQLLPKVNNTNSNQTEALETTRQWRLREVHLEVDWPKIILRTKEKIMQKQGPKLMQKRNHFIATFMQSGPGWCAMLCRRHRGCVEPRKEDFNTKITKRSQWNHFLGLFFVGWHNTMDQETTKGILCSPLWLPTFYTGFTITDKSISLRSLAILENRGTGNIMLFLKVNRWWSDAYLESFTHFTPSLAWKLQFQLQFPKLEHVQSNKTIQETTRSMQYHLSTSFNR